MLWVLFAEHIRYLNTCGVSFSVVAIHYIVVAAFVVVLGCGGGWRRGGGSDSFQEIE